MNGLVIWTGGTQPSLPRKLVRCRYATFVVELKERPWLEVPSLNLIHRRFPQLRSRCLSAYTIKAPRDQPIGVYPHRSAPHIVRIRSKIGGVSRMTIRWTFVTHTSLLVKYHLLRISSSARKVRGPAGSIGHVLSSVVVVFGCEW